MRKNSQRRALPAGRFLALPLLAALLVVGCQSGPNSKTEAGAGTAAGPDQDKGRTWSVYKGDAHSSNYSPLNQITVQNVSQLKPAWTVALHDTTTGGKPGNAECNPIIVDGVLYAHSAQQILYALDASTGKQLWRFDAFGGKNEGLLSRGVTYWESGDDKRILATAGEFLYALDARTGQPIASFGQGGKIDLRVGLRDAPEKILTAPTTPGIVSKNLLILGTQARELYGSPPGYVRAYDCRTGQLSWTFHTLPEPGEPGSETWPKNAHRYTGGVNDWVGMSLDAERGIVYTAIGSPSYDFYGADRAGANLYSDCVLALDAATGKYKWHFQMVHHDMWDYDPPAPPTLVQVKRDGQAIDAMAQITKQGFVFVLDRATGKSLFPVEERPVPASHLPGEHSWPTQPFPLKPKPFSRQLLTEADLTNFSPADHAAILQKFRSLRYEGLYTPPDLKGTLQFPGTRGGGEWGGAAYDPATDFLYIKSTEAPDVETIVTINQSQNTDLKQKALFAAGTQLYATNCAQCHRQDKGGREPNFPALLGIKHTLSRAAALQKILHAPGHAYASVIKTQKEQDELMAFVYDTELSGDSKTPGKTPAERLATEKYLNVTGYKTFSDPSGNPAITPPWGTLNALNLSTGEYTWKIPLGNDAQRQQPGAPETGLESKGGPIATAGGLLFISGTKDNQLRALDKATGKIVWQTTIPGFSNTTPCTYWSHGKQYVALVMGGTKENPSGFIQAYALP